MQDAQLNTCPWRRISIRRTMGIVGVLALLAALLLAGPGCSDSSSASGDDLSWFDPDGGGERIPWSDVHSPPPPPPPPPPPDAGPPPPDGPVTPLTPTFTGPFYEHPLPGALEVGTLVGGGAPPYECILYTGPGRGTLPSAMTMSSCKLTGGFGPDDPPGSYGFIVMVEDRAQQKIEVPIVVRNGECNTTAASVTPPEYPVRVVNPPGGAYDWQWQIADVDTPCAPDPPGCVDCAGCVKHAVGTKTPLQLTSFLDCDKTGDLCIAGSDIQNPAACPNTAPVSWSAVIRVKEHPPLRSDGGVAWVTVEADAVYSGDKTGNDCGDKKWACHIEVLETP